MVTVPLGRSVSPPDIAGPVGGSYEPFSREPEYVEVNERFVRALDLDGARHIADLACGTGTMTRLLLDELARLGLQTIDLITGVESSPEALVLAETYLSVAGPPYKPRLRLVRGELESLPLQDDSVDVAVIGNAIQLIEDKGRVVDEVHRVLRPGGLFGFNTSFYAGAYLPGTERFYLTWVQEALRRVSGSGRRSRHVGSAKPAFSNRWLSAGEYVDLLERHGFELRHVVERRVLLTGRSLKTIGGYAGLATVLLNGFPIAEACKALQAAVEPALTECGLDVVPRGWLEVSVRRRGSGRAGPRTPDD